jgi:hypothetical protein
MVLPCCDLFIVRLRATGRGLILPTVTSSPLFKGITVRAKQVFSATRLANEFTYFAFRCFIEPPLTSAKDQSCGPMCELPFELDSLVDSPFVGNVELEEMELAVELKGWFNPERLEPVESLLK